MSSTSSAARKDENTTVSITIPKAVIDIINTISRIAVIPSNNFYCGCCHDKEKDDSNKTPP